MLKRIALPFVLLLSTAMLCQQAASPAAQASSPTISEVRLVPVKPSDLYCAGFITNENLPKSNYVIAGWDAPNFVRQNTGSFIYLNGVLPEGSEYSLVRELRNPDSAEFFTGQRRAVKMAGSFYGEVGRVKIVGKNEKVSIAQIEFSCDSALPGDYAVPYHEREALQERHMIPFNRFPAPNNLLRGRIVMQKDFQAYAGPGSTVYLNVGSEQGVKVGEYFRAVRGYGRKSGDVGDRATYEATLYDDEQKNMIITDGSPLQFGGKHESLSKLPERALGELVVVNVSPKSSTAMVAFSLEDLQVGDYAVRDELPPATAAEMATRANPPQIACSAQPDTVRIGGSTLISCETQSDDGGPVSISFTSDRGKLESGADHGAMLQTAGVPAGQINVTATATDDRNLKSVTTLIVNVEAASLNNVITPPSPVEPPAAGPSKVAEVHFASGSNVLTNDSKVQLNQLALRLDRESAGTKVVIVGQSKGDTPAANRLAQRRAENVKSYFVNDKQVKEDRIETRTTSGDDKAEVWFVPAGATMK